MACVKAAGRACLSPLAQRSGLCVAAGGDAYSPVISGIGAVPPHHAHRSPRNEASDGGALVSVNCPNVDRSAGPAAGAVHVKPQPAGGAGRAHRLQRLRTRLGYLNGLQIKNEGAGIFTRKPKRRHIPMTGRKAPAQSARERI